MEKLTFNFLMNINYIFDLTVLVYISIGNKISFLEPISELNSRENN